MYLFEIKQNHPDQHAGLLAAVTKSRKLQAQRDLSKTCSIEDLIVLLVAKENMPVRIVDSPYFAELLQGNAANV